MAELSTQAQRSPQWPFNEFFCQMCSAHAEEFWKEKITIIQEMNTQMDKRLTKHRRNFFNAKRNESKPSTE
jgi:hypothetical protein